MVAIPHRRPPSRGQWAACRSKLRYATAWAAWGVLKRTHRRPGYADGRAHVYRCPVCHMYHIGRDDPSPGRRPRYQRTRHDITVATYLSGIPNDETGDMGESA